MKANILIGIDVGGTHTDGVAVDADTGVVLRKLKVPTRSELVESINQALSALIDGADPEAIRRVSLSTTLVTNAVVTKRLEPVGMILLSGPGLDASQLSDDPNCKVVTGSIDHRGREIVGLDRAQIDGILSSFTMKGISTVGVAGKFSVRNPFHENEVAKMAERAFDYVACSHILSGALNFPRRATTAWLSAGVWRRHTNFITSARKTAARLNLTAPLYLLRADGGAQRAETFSNAAEAALSGPAASIMGVAAVADLSTELVGLDVGGTTTDISFFVRGAPLVEPQGATIGENLTQIRALYNRSIAAGGDSAVRVVDGKLKVGPQRSGPPACRGGVAPTPTDALVSLGVCEGDKTLADAALTKLADELDVEAGAVPGLILSELASMIAGETHRFLDEVNSRPVYTIHELLEDHRVTPELVVLVGGPANGLKDWIGKAFSLPVVVPPHFEVANAIGAAVASLNTEVNAIADTGAGWMTIPEAGIHKKVGKEYSFEEMLSEAKAELTSLAGKLGAEEGSLVLDVAEQESFNIIEGHGYMGSIHRLRLQVRPSILCRIGGEP